MPRYVVEANPTGNDAGYKTLSVGIDSPSLSDTRAGCEDRSWACKCINKISAAVDAYSNRASKMNLPSLFGMKGYGQPSFRQIHTIPKEIQHTI
jgi:hypothetical protein